MTDNQMWHNMPSLTEGIRMGTTYKSRFSSNPGALVSSTHY